MRHHGRRRRRGSHDPYVSTLLRRQHKRSWTTAIYITIAKKQIYWAKFHYTSNATRIVEFLSKYNTIHFGQDNMETDHKYLSNLDFTGIIHTVSFTLIFVHVYLFFHLI